MLNNIYTQLLRDKSRDIAEKVSLKIGLVLNELNILRAASQQLIDKDELHSLGKELQSNSYIKNDFIYNSEKNWSNLAKSEINVSMSVWGYLHNDDGSINSKTKDYISMMTPIKMLMKIIGEYGTDKGWFYLTGPKTTPVMIMTPWEQMPDIFDGKYPGHNEKNWWDFFFPGIVESWNKWILNPEFINNKVHNQVTLTPLYEDAGGTGLMITFFAPLWNKKRTQNFGTAAVDYNMGNILDIVKNEKIGETGFTFLVQADGNILGLTGEIAEKLELSKSSNTESGVEISYFNIRNSHIKALSEIAHKFNEIKKFTIHQFTDNKGKDFLLSFEKLMDYNLWNGKNKEIIRDSLYIAAIVQKEEVFKAQHRINSEINILSYDTMLFLICSSLFFAFISILFAGWYALQNTKQIRKISHGLNKLGEKKYDISIDIIDRDDLGELARSFNYMANEICNAYKKLENYAYDLENTVKERTAHLEEANIKLQQLSNIDGLTKVHNRRYFDMKLEEIWREYSRLSHPISVILIDIDHFKKYNDTYGHQAGDSCLCSVASALKKQTKRSSDVIARYGGEEFVVIACIGIDASFELAEEMRLAVEALSIEHELSNTKIVSISLGVASIVPSKNNEMAELIKNADMALYRSKENGRNMVSVS
ncbi:MAG: diguanylate cyclase [Desulfamplus sp.]|nr:diguanylate cyclase [Desulfamplus sp.]